MTKTTDVNLTQGTKLKEEDSAPNLQAELLEESTGGTLTISGSTQTENPDLTGATVVFNMVDSDGSLVINRASVTITDAASGEVEYDWSSSDTSTAGDYEGEFEVTFDDGEVVSYPNDKNFGITITEDLG